jgi:hypothetical protein
VMPKPHQHRIEDAADQSTGLVDRRREAMISRQIRVTDVIGDEFGAMVAPLVTKPFRGPWPKSGFRSATRGREPDRR